MQNWLSWTRQCCVCMRDMTPWWARYAKSSDSSLHLRSTYSFTIKCPLLFYCTTRALPLVINVGASNNHLHLISSTLMHTSCAERLETQRRRKAESGHCSCLPQACLICLSIDMHKSLAHSSPAQHLRHAALRFSLLPCFLISSPFKTPCCLSYGDMHP